MLQKIPIIKIISRALYEFTNQISATLIDIHNCMITNNLNVSGSFSLSLNLLMILANIFFRSSQLYILSELRTKKNAVSKINGVPGTPGNAIPM